MYGPAHLIWGRGAVIEDEVCDGDTVVVKLVHLIGRLAHTHHVTHGVTHQLL